MAKMCRLRSSITGYSALPVPMVHLIHGIFSYEMTAVATALFKGDRSVRTSQKSQLEKHIIGRKYPSIKRKDYHNSAGRVYDGCALIHRLAWPNIGTMCSVCETFVGYVQAPAAPDVHVCVVFDSYTIGKQRRLQSKNGGSLRLAHIQMCYK